MSTDQKKGSPIVATLLLLLLLVLLGIGVQMFFPCTVSGSAALPNGATLDITGAFNAAEYGDRTHVNFGGRTFESTTSTITVDGVKLGELDDGAKQLSLRNESGAVILESDGTVIDLPD